MTRKFSSLTVLLAFLAPIVFFISAQRASAADQLPNVQQQPFFQINLNVSKKNIPPSATLIWSMTGTPPPVNTLCDIWRNDQMQGPIDTVPCIQTPYTDTGVHNGSYTYQIKTTVNGKTTESNQVPITIEGQLENLVQPTETIVPAETTTQATDFRTFVKTVFNIIYVVAPILAILALIFAGFRYITSQGDPEAIKLANDVIYGALSGLLLLLMAKVLLNTLVGNDLLDLIPDKIF